ncbi:MAG TPA: hypothetical protein DCX32_02325 [Candidatus Moranbacteria bacterium]|nr:MAG: hypothetical protein UW95_C0029G0004 [Parcubacteria group bacterium GW2011_GWC1_45_14]HAV11356.1 hypothetical protein [Candidatus Moranbacteria bacterium]
MIDKWRMTKAERVILLNRIYVFLLLAFAIILMLSDPILPVISRELALVSVFIWINAISYFQETENDPQKQCAEPDSLDEISREIMGDLQERGYYDKKGRRIRGIPPIGKDMC